MNDLGVTETIFARPHLLTSPIPNLNPNLNPNANPNILTFPVAPFLGMLYKDGEEVEQDLSQAKKWWHLAAESEAALLHNPNPELTLTLPPNPKPKHVGRRRVQSRSTRTRRHTK